MFGVLGYLKSLVLTNYWQTIDLVGEISQPILFVTGTRDEVVPTEQTQRLFDASVKSRMREIWVSEKGNHNNTWSVDK